METEPHDGTTDAPGADIPGADRPHSTCSTWTWRRCAPSSTRCSPRWSSDLRERIAAPGGEALWGFNNSM